MTTDGEGVRHSLIIVGTTLAAAFLAGIIYVLLIALVNPTVGVGGVMARLAAAGWNDDLFLAFLVSGALAGFLSSGFGVGNPTVRWILRVIANLLLFVFGGLAGAFFGVLAYIAFWVATHPGQSLADAVVRLPTAYASLNDPFSAFLFAGALAGLAVTAYMLGSHLARRFARGTSGAVLGGIAGLCMFSIAYVVVNRTPDAPASFILVLFANAIYAFSILEFAFIGVGAIVGTVMARYSWRLYGLFTLVALVTVVLGYLLYSLAVTLPRVDPAFLPLSIVLFLAETATLIMVVLYSFYTLDVASRKRWRRGPEGAAFSPYYMPKVAFQVPAFNEPPELVISTLKRLLSMDYPEDQFVVMMLDDSTDPASSEPVRRFCEKHGVMYVHRVDRGGYKAGALNNAMQYTPDDVELIAIIDADYWVEPEYLRETVGYFVDPEIAWLQTPQDYRNKHQSFLTEQYYLADAYFYRTVLPSRNEENSIIFCGTMGLLRKDALVQVGRWGEEFITEDAELSIRLVSAGWKSLYVNKTYGRGLIPPTFEGYKKQHYRWSFGGAKILRGHYKTILFGRFTPRQTFDYFVSSIHWFEGIFVLMISLAILALGLGEILGLDLATHHSEEILLIGLVPMFLLLDGFTRMHMVLRKTLGLSFGGTLRVMGMWFSVKFSNMFASMKALAGVSIPFVRTAKAPEARVSRGEAAWRALQLTRFETVLAVLFYLTSAALFVKTWALVGGGGSTTIVRFFLAFWLLYYALVYTAAPWYAYKSYVTFQPEGEAAPVPASRGVPQ